MKWPQVELQDIALQEKGAIVSGPFGSNISAKYFVDEGIPVIRGNNLSKGKGKFIDHGFAYLTETKAAEFRNCMAVTDDIIFTAAGSIGQVGIIPPKARYEKYVISNKQLRVRLDRSKANPNCVFAWLSSPQMVRYLENMNNGGAVPLLNLGIIRRVPVPLPPMEIQEKIAEILSTYYDLIENNRRRIALLEAAARVLYREWFVYFRFPGHEYVKIVDGIPEGWARRTLVELAEVVMGQSPKSQFYNEAGDGLPFHQGVTDYGFRFVSHRTYSTALTKLAEAGNILVSVRAPVGRINITRDKIVLGRGLASVRSRTDHQSFLFYALKNHFYAEDIIGTGAIYTATNKKELERQTLIEPHRIVLAEFEEQARDIDQNMANLTTQNEKLAQARDLLLPRLMNGEITV